VSTRFAGYFQQLLWLAGLRMRYCSAWRGDRRMDDRMG
jgi:hypothetical protein